MATDPPKPTGRVALHVALPLVVGVAVVAISARVSWTIPGTSVPQSAQTLAVVLVGAFFGARKGSATLVGYLLAGAAGLPVFADGAAGWTHLHGPTAGYLVGFVGAAWLVGHLGQPNRLRQLLPALAVMLTAHGLIFGTGWARLAISVGPAVAFAEGVAPFIFGAVLKSAAGAGVVVVWLGVRRPLQGSDSGA